MPSMTDKWPEKDKREASRHEIYHTAFLLRQKLVPDLVPSILRYADKFESFTVEQRYNPYVWVFEREAPYPVFTTPPIAASVQVKQPVQKVTFEIESHDQGMCSDPNAGNWTWFSARIVKAGQPIPPSIEQDEQSGENDNSTPRMISFPYRPRPPLVTHTMRRHVLLSPDNKVPHTDSSDRQLFKNELASSQFRWHTADWHVDSFDQAEAQWVQSLEQGDSICIVAWARFPGWANYVQHVKVTIHTVACSH
ncbi:hypothetical protein K461DRAFT_136076 [Myriangium duriaei CBS 260.36]|uniref:Uncharacterized protein n=1 Tax=Myriangium duriaei CBS 260.36 TaxID=1168546 RepID=A0A9P4J488_9PEZI|nr:hypothetical protein K461DRAFT_136076 [Myriangium duriaei CBS 260.36]